ncbi:hypothetical protein HAHE_24680 [Haloferula helveola]|uniref:Secreted protein n=1 Tax=Haloferula helveola TaxID=490095 RepID=A0ABM7REM7_9BACT|nr:hypothetical protein HAHE_24680 [Haloferula helveola]
MKTATSIIFAFVLASPLSADEMCTRVHQDLEQADGSYSDLWRLTVEPQDGQLVLATFSIDVDEEPDTAGIPPGRRVETIHYAPSGRHTEKVGYVKFPNDEDRKGVDGFYYKKWIVSGFGQEIKFGPMFRLGGGGGSARVEGEVPFRHQSVRRRFRFGDREENPTKEFRFVLSLETIEFHEAAAKAATAKVELPERKDRSWSIELPARKQSAEPDGADQPAIRSKPDSEGGDRPQSKSEEGSR